MTFRWKKKEGLPDFLTHVEEGYEAWIGRSYLLSVYRHIGRNEWTWMVHGLGLPREGYGGNSRDASEAQIAAQEKVESIIKRIRDLK